MITFKKYIMLLALMAVTAISAQAQEITSVHGNVSDEMGPLMGATVCEIDGNGRIIESAVTDLNGNFTMKVRNQKDKIRFSYVGMKTITQSINKTNFKIVMTDNTTIAPVTIQSKRRVGGNNLPIPQREVANATQNFSMKEVEGLSFTTIDEAMQGRIAGLDIIGNSGDLGSGSTMRLRGASSLSTLTDSNPLIVVDGNVRQVSLQNFDIANANNEKFAELLNINPEDISDIRVLKDAAATAIYGSQGGNGVIELTTKRGARGKPRLQYSLKLTGTYQPKGYNLLNGDDYTMLLKESYFNPEQSDAAADIPELNYDPSFSEYEQYNNNTDWRDAVTQWGLRQNHYVTVSGGGEKALFRIGAGYDHETGTMIEQKLQRFSTRVALDYNVSERIRVSTNFSMTYTKNERNSDGLLDIAMKKMPNMSIYEQDPVTGENTSSYYTMLQSGSSVFNNDQKGYVNPVASAHLAKNQQSTYDMQPELIIQYQLLGMDDDHWQLNWRGQVYLNINNGYSNRYYPQELKSVSWDQGVNTTSDSSSKSVSFNTKQTLTLIPSFKNKDHSFMMLGRFELNSGTSTSQSEDKKGVPTGITTTQGGGLITNLSSNFSQHRSMYFTASAHYAYKGRYIIDGSLRADGTTKFGPSSRWGYFPSLSLKWIISDEPWMEPTRKWLSMFAIRPSWGRSGQQPGQDYLYTSKYGSTDRYIDMQAMKPNNIRLTDMKWQITESWNGGIDLGFFNDRLTVTIEGYSQTTKDMLLSNYRIPSNTGYENVAYKNQGKMRNTGWEFHISSNRVITIGKKFWVDVNANFGNNRNELLELDELTLDNYNTVFGFSNDETLQRVQLHNPLGAIYGFRYKGVYQYNYSTFKRMTPEERTQFLAEGKTAPVAIGADGNLIVDGKGDPVRMMFNYTNDATGRNYRFNGGDAIYEDVNHDGQINALDIVYLGSSLPKLTGGFGFSFTYGDWRLSTQFTYRFGNKIINRARLHAEAMTGNDNQSQAVNYRWRKEGDITSIPRAMYGSNSNYNTLISDRFVEDGSYLRMGYAQLNYNIRRKYAQALGVNRISLYLSANNPFVLTKYSGVDPDISSGGYSPAIDSAQTPRSRSYTLGITVEF
ncbi:MAG: SusC/RagA family TonB-linked outer membrane protein [Prevotella sp.]|nr:SusC/RagA family TonB-linked outer membrane protein [Prevotella sp.]